jgi:hypothetical protein
MQTTYIKINIAIAEAIGYRRWRFGDRWVKGLQLADLRFNGYIRRVIEDAPANAEYVKLDIDEAETQKTAHVLTDYIPASHWVSPDNKITARPPNFAKNLNAMHIAESYLTADEFYKYDNLLPLAAPQKCFNTALGRAVSWLRAKNISYA